MCIGMNMHMSMRMDMDMFYMSMSMYRPAGVLFDHASLHVLCVIFSLTD